MNYTSANSYFNINFGTRYNESFQESNSKDNPQEILKNSNLDVSNKENGFLVSSDHQRVGLERKIIEQRIEEEEEGEEEKQQNRVKGYRMPLSDESVNQGMMSSQRQISFSKYKSKECCKNVHLEKKTDESQKANRDRKKLNLSDKASKKKTKSIREEKFKLRKSQLIDDLNKRKMEYIKCLGGGLHGNVIEIKDDHGFSQAMKLYDLDDEGTFRKEVSILTRNKINRRKVKGYNRYRLTDYYGVVIKLGVGTLLTFRDFIKHEKIKLTEEDLISIFFQIFSRYEEMRRFSLYHRDIKPQNIVIYEDVFELNIIDFGMSTLQQSNLSGRSGTPGFIPESVYYKVGDFTHKDLIECDLYAIAITMLILAVLDFWPTQNDTDGVKEALQQVSHFETLYPILQYLLLLPTRDTKKRFKELIKEKRTNSNLSYFKDKFMQYIKSSAQETIEEYRSQLRNNFDELVVLLHSDKKKKKVLHEIQKDLEYYKENKQRKGELYCYQALIMLYKVTKEWTKACEEISKALEEKTEFKFHFLVYLMLSCYYYWQNNLKKAAEKLREGMRQSHNMPYEQMVFLKESLHIRCSFDFGEEDLDDIYHKTNKSIERIMLEKFNFFVTEWLSGNLPKKEKLVNADPAAHINTRHLLNFTHLGPNLKKASIKPFLLEFFYLKCYKKAQDFISIIKKAKNTPLIENASHFTAKYHLMKKSFLVCPPYYEFLMTLLSFKKELSLSSLSSIPIKLKDLLQEIEYLEAIEEEIYTSTEKDIAALCKTYNLNEILFTMIGLTLISIEDGEKRPEKWHAQPSRYKSKVAKKLALATQELKSIILSEISHPASSLEPSSTILFDKSIAIVPESGDSHSIDEEPQLQRQLFKEKIEFASRFSYPVKLEANWPAVKYYYGSDVKHPIPALQKIVETLFDDSCVLIPDDYYFQTKTAHTISLKTILDTSQQGCLINSLSLTMAERGEHCTSQLKYFGNMELEEIKFGHLPNTTFAGLSDSLCSLNLIKLTLSFKHLKEFPKERTQNVMKAISSQRLLKYLELNYQVMTMGSFIIQTLIGTLNDLAELEELHLLLRRCSNISDEALIALKDFLKDFHQLQSMNIQLGFTPDISLKQLDKLKIEFGRIYPNYSFETMDLLNNDEDEDNTFMC